MFLLLDLLRPLIFVFACLGLAQWTFTSAEAHPAGRNNDHLKPKGGLPPPIAIATHDPATIAEQDFKDISDYLLKCHYPDITEDALHTLAQGLGNKFSGVEGRRRLSEVLQTARDRYISSHQRTYMNFIERVVDVLVTRLEAWVAQHDPLSNLTAAAIDSLLHEETLFCTVLEQLEKTPGPVSADKQNLSLRLINYILQLNWIQLAQSHGHQNQYLRNEELSASHQALRVDYLNELIERVPATQDIGCRSFQAVVLEHFDRARLIRQDSMKGQMFGVLSRCMELLDGLTQAAYDAFEQYLPIARRVMVAALPKNTLPQDVRDTLTRGRLPTLEQLRPAVAEASRPAYQNFFVMRWILSELMPFLTRGERWVPFINELRHVVEDAENQDISQDVHAEETLQNQLDNFYAQHKRDFVDFAADEINYYFSEGNQLIAAFQRLRTNHNLPQTQPHLPVQGSLSANAIDTNETLPRAEPVDPAAEIPLATEYNERDPLAVTAEQID